MVEPSPAKSSPLDAVLLLGSGRSGTTWLAEAIDHDRSHRLLFEPLNGRKVPEVAHFVFHSQYVRADCADPRYTEPLDAILRGQIDHRWVNRRRGPPGGRRLLIKLIRAHLMIEWLRRRAPHIPMVFLVRHPLAVAISRLQLGWDTHLDELLGQPELIADYFPARAARLRALVDPFEQHVATWAIENAVALKQLQGARARVVHYEHLCVRFDDELAGVLDHLGRAAPESADRLRDTPSQLVAEHSAIVQGSDPLRQWMSRCGPDRRARAGEILSWFGLDGIYGTDATPRVHLGEWLQP